MVRTPLHSNPLQTTWVYLRHICLRVSLFPPQSCTMAPPHVVVSNRDRVLALWKSHPRPSKRAIGRTRAFASNCSGHLSPTPGAQNARTLLPKVGVAESTVRGIIKEWKNATAAQVHHIRRRTVTGNPMRDQRWLKYDPVTSFVRLHVLVIVRN